jgi:hypothetical protein
MPGYMRAFVVFGRTFKLLFEDLFPLFLMNAVTTICLLLVIPGPAACAGLNHVCHRCVKGYAISWDHYWDAFRKHGLKWTPFVFFSYGVYALVLLNIWWYPRAFADQAWVPWVQGAWLSVFVLWTCVQLLVYALWVEQEQKGWQLALRNAALLAGTSPMFSLLCLMLTALLFLGIGLLIAPLLVVFGVVFWVMLGHAALQDRLKAYRKRMGIPEPKDELADP